MFVYNSFVQSKVLGSGYTQACENATALLTSNAAKNPNKAIPALKTLMIVSPLPTSVLPPLVDRLFPPLLSQYE